MGSTLNLLEYLLFEFVSRKYYGTVEIKFEAGIPVLIRKTETIKPKEQDCRDTRGANEYNHD